MGCSNPRPGGLLLAVWARDGVGVEPGREHSGMLGVMWMPRGPKVARHMGKHTFPVWPLFFILQAPIMFCELSEFWWVIWLLIWVAPGRCFTVCAGRTEKLRDFSASWLNRRRRNWTFITLPVLAPWSLTLTVPEPGACPRLGKSQQLDLSTRMRAALLQVSQLPSSSPKWGFTHRRILLVLCWL